MPDHPFTIVGLGEILWDLLPSGKQLGGAPANFAYHAQALGASASPVTIVGNDELGREILDRLSALGEPADCVQMDDSAPTGTVTVEMLGDGDHRFTIHEGVAWDNLEADSANLALAQSANAVCFGTLAQRSPVSRHAIQTIVAATRSDALRIFDINLRQHYYSMEVIEQSLHAANVLKLNHEELPIVAEMLGLDGAPIERLAQISKRYGIVLAALTRGGAGSLLLAGDRISDHAGVPVKIVDSIGAGDAFTAAMTLGWLAGWDLEEINHRANEVASYVCTQPGATPALPPGITAPFATATNR